MAIAELVLKYLDTLVWPVVTVVLVWMLRAQIRQAFGRLTRLETPAGTLEFEAEARAARDEADDLRAPVVEGPADEGVSLPDPVEVPDGGSRGGGADAPAQPSDLPSSGSRRRRDHLLDMAEHAPLQAMTEAWGSLVWSGLDVLRTRGRAAPDGARTPHERAAELLRGLGEMGLPPHTTSLFERLQALWEGAMAHPDAVTSAAAGDYVRSCRLLARELRELIGPGTQSGGTA
ncbi:hypothetical protein ABZ874_09135 [Streptomyces albidoflavus]|uniref:hypothetical protein n=1 Tax=Streptomyces albidoflavus TaxID=1886 RepID=UPI0033F9F5AC